MSRDLAPDVSSSPTCSGAVPPPSPDIAPTEGTRALGERRVCRFAGKTRHSVLYYAEFSNLLSPVAIKVCLDPETGLASPSIALEQYKALERVWRIWDEAGEFRCVRPYALFQDHAALAVQWVAGRSLTGVLQDFRTSSAERRHRVRQAGGWLCRFHEAGGRGSVKIDAADRQDALMALVGGHAGRSRAFRKGIDALSRTASTVSRCVVRCSWVHGDFKADNVMIANSDAYGIDIRLRHENAIVYDIGSFLNHLELMCIDPRCPWLMNSWRQLGSEFLAGYFGRDPRPDEQAIAWVRLYQLLHLWSAVSVAGRNSARRILLQMTFKGVARRLRRQLG